MNTGKGMPYNYDGMGADQATRAIRRDMRRSAEHEARTTEERNILLLRGDARFMAVCRAYSMADEAGRAQLGELAEKVMAEVQEKTP